MDSAFLLNPVSRFSFLFFFFFFFAFTRLREQNLLFIKQILLFTHVLFHYCSHTIHHCSSTVHTLKNIKNGSHGTIHTFKNYFLQCFQFSVFNFSNNKFNPNGPIINTKRNRYNSTTEFH